MYVDWRRDSAQLTILHSLRINIGVARLIDFHNNDYKYNLPYYIYILCFSCFLLTMHSDSIEGIYDTLKQTALISKSAGGIGLNVHCIRSTGSYIAGVNNYYFRSNL